MHASPQITERINRPAILKSGADNIYRRGLRSLHQVEEEENNELQKEFLTVAYLLLLLHGGIVFCFDWAFSDGI
jgi:hypothetical protein